MDNISPICMGIEERRHGGFNLQTQTNIHGDTFPQHYKCKVHKIRTYRPIFNLSTFVMSASTISVAEGRGRDKLQ